MCRSNEEISNPLLPRPAKVLLIKDEARYIKTLRLKPVDGVPEFTPGQFVMVGVFGYGEAPFAIASSPLRADYIEVSVRAVGDVTRAIHNLSPGDWVGIRGPYGRGFPVKDWEGKNVIVVAGGTGLFGVSALIWYLYEFRSRYGRVVLFYGARTPDDIPRWNDIKVWNGRIETYLTVNRPNDKWKGDIGLVTTLLDKYKLPRRDVVFVICGPPIMIRAVYDKLSRMDYRPKDMYVSLERRMQCGIGKCGACMLSNGLYVCKDGPVFRIDEIPEADLS